MKKLVIIAVVLVLCCLAAFAYAQTARRESLYQRFGPKQMEAQNLWFLSQINALRAQHGLKTITADEMMDGVKAQLDVTSDYEWMNRQALAPAQQQIR